VVFEPRKERLWQDDHGHLFGGFGDHRLRTAVVFPDAGDELAIHEHLTRLEAGKRRFVRAASDLGLSRQGRV
jgi:hypothetical protein